MTERPWPTPPADLFDLTGKGALVTGSSMGLGAGMAAGLAQAGDRNPTVFGAELGLRSTRWVTEK